MILNWILNNKKILWIFQNHTSKRKIFLLQHHQFAVSSIKRWTNIDRHIVCPRQTSSTSQLFVQIGSPSLFGPNAFALVCLADLIKNGKRYDLVFGKTDDQIRPMFALRPFSLSTRRNDIQF